MRADKWSILSLRGCYMKWELFMFFFTNLLSYIVKSVQRSSSVIALVTYLGAIHQSVGLSCHDVIVSIPSLAICNSFFLVSTAAFSPMGSKNFSFGIDPKGTEK